MVKTTTEMLFSSKDIYRIIVDSAEEGIWIADNDGVITYVNNKLVSLLCYDKDQLIGKKMFDFTDDKNRAIMKKSLEESRKGKRDNYSYSVRNKRGEFIPMMVATTPMQDEKGVYIGTVELMSDISYQKKIEDALRERETHLKMSQELAHLGSWLWDIRNNKQVWSDERYRIFGLSPGEIEPTLELYLNFIHPEDRASTENALFEAIREKKPFVSDYRAVRKDGAIRYMHSEGRVTYDDKGEPVKMDGISQDISERKQVEAVMRESQSRLEAVLSSITEGVVISDVSGNIIKFNDAAQRIHGFKVELEYLKHVSEFTKTFELYDLNSRLLPLEEWPLSRALRGDTFLNYDVIIKRKDTGYRGVFSFGGAPVRDKEDHIILAVLTIGDITERVQNEIALKESKTRADLYIDLMGHDINNLNQSAMGFLELALEQLETDKKLGLESKPLIENPLKALDNSSKLIDNVRMLQRLMTEGVKTEHTDLCQLIKSIDVQSFMPKGRNITINVHAMPLCIVEANELLRDAIINLVSNAIKHSEEGKPLTIDVEVEPVKENGQLFYKCIVEDNGPGIPDELKTKLFHRFQRGSTKAYGKGLGLYLVRTLVEGYHGKVWVEDRVKGDHTKGSRFVMLLHAMEDSNGT